MTAESQEKQKALNPLTKEHRGGEPCKSKRGNEGGCGEGDEE
jgi:hypothetical protein